MKRKIPVLRTFCDANGNCGSCYIYSTHRELLEEYASQLLRERGLIGQHEFVKFSIKKEKKNA